MGRGRGASILSHAGHEGDDDVDTEEVNNNGDQIWDDKCDDNDDDSEKQLSWN